MKTNEWKVLRGWKIWSNRFNTKEKAEKHMNEEQDKNHNYLFTCEQMTNEEMKKYL